MLALFSLLFVITRLPHAFSPPNFHARPLKRQASKAIATLSDCLARSRYFILFLLRRVAVCKAILYAILMHYIYNGRVFSDLKINTTFKYIYISHTLPIIAFLKEELSDRAHLCDRFLRGTRTKRNRDCWYREIRGCLRTDTTEEAPETHACTHMNGMITKGRTGKRGRMGLIHLRR